MQKAHRNELNYFWAIKNTPYIYSNQTILLWQYYFLAYL